MTREQLQTWRWLSLSAVCLLAAAAHGDQGHPPDPLFQSQDRLDIVIEAPFATLMRDKPKEEYLNGTLRVMDGDTVDEAFDIELRARGHSRHEYCDFPPVLLHFKKSDVKDTLFVNQNKVKLVVHCMTSAKYEQIVLKEYLVYRMLNVITDRSFRVRLAQIRYVDSEGKRSDIQRYAFLLEHKKRLAVRHDTERLRIEKTNVRDIQGDHLNLASVFAYMVGNTDFSPIRGPKGDECCHNFTLFSNGVDPILAVPYDFDQSGVVDAPYAEPNRQFGIRTVKQRVYRGRCANNDYLEASLQQFRDSRDEIFALIAEQEGFSDATRRRVEKYIEDFFKIIDDPKKVEKQMVDRCA